MTSDQENTYCCSLRSQLRNTLPASPEGVLRKDQKVILSLPLRSSDITFLGSLLRNGAGFARARGGKRKKKERKGMSAMN